MRRYALRDDQWERMKDRLPGRDGHAGVTAGDNRLSVEAVLHRYRAGIPRRDPPDRSGDWKEVHARFSRRAEAGVGARVFRRVAGEAGNGYAMIGSTRSSAPIGTAPGPRGERTAEASGRSRGGLTARIHATVEALGSPTGFALTPGQAQDLDGADALLPGVGAGMVIADEASDAGERVLRPLEPAGKTAVIPPRANRHNPRPYDRELDRARHLIENSSARLEQDRAIATRYDERAVPFLGAIHLAAAIIRLN